MRRCVVAIAIAGSGIVACSLMTDFEQFTSGDGRDASASAEGSVLTGDAGSPPNDGAVEAGLACASTIDVSRDPKNCGVCGHDCLGGECRRGQCQPTAIAKDIRSPNGLAMTSAGLYIGSDEGMLLLPTNGDLQHLTDSASVGPQFVAATATDVFFADYDGNAIKRIGIGSRDIVTIKEDLPRAIGVAVSSSFIFFTREAAQLTGRMPMSTTPLPTDTKLDVLVTSFHADGIDWASGMIYVASYDDDQVIEIKDDGTASTRRKIYEGGAPYGVKVDGRFAYITCNKAGTLVRVNLDGDPKPEELASGLASPNGIALTPDAIYIAESGGGTVLKLAR